MLIDFARRWSFFGPGLLGLRPSLARQSGLPVAGEGDVGSNDCDIRRSPLASISLIPWSIRQDGDEEEEESLGSFGFWNLNGEEWASSGHITRRGGGREGGQSRWCRSEPHQGSWG